MRSLYAAIVTLLLGEQYGIKPERFAPHAIAIFLGDGQNALGRANNKLYAVFTHHT
jgi:hypothetical protein